MLNNDACVVVTAGRWHEDLGRLRRLVRADLGALRAAGLSRVAAGDAVGGDQIALEEAALLGLDVSEPYKPCWRTALGLQDRAAGHRRNEGMLRAEAPDGVLAYPGPASCGTWQLVAATLRLEVPVVVALPPCPPIGLRPDLRVVAETREAVRRYLSAGELGRLTLLWCGAPAPGSRVALVLRHDDVSQAARAAERSLRLLSLLPEVVS